MELAIMAALVICEADTRIAEALGVAQIPFKTDYVTAVRLAIAVPGVLPSILLVAAQPMTPTISALIVTFLIWRRRGLKELASRVRPWCGGVTWRAGLCWWATCIGIFLLMSAWTAGLNRFLLNNDEFAWEFNPLSRKLLPALLIALFADGGAGQVMARISAVVGSGGDQR